MPITSRIVGPSGDRAIVTGDGSLAVSNHQRTFEDYTADEVRAVKVLIGHMATSAGAFSMDVDGSTNAVEFEVASAVDCIRWINQIRLIIQGQKFNLSNNEARGFGNSSALTTGCELEAIQGGSVTPIFHDPVQRVSDFRRYTATGGNSIINDIDAVANGVDFVLLVFDLPAPVGLFPGSEDRIVFRINDDLTAALGGTDHSMEALVYGWQIGECTTALV